MNQNDYRIADRLPESLNRDNIRELADTIDAEMAEINQMSELVSIYPRIDELSPNLIDALAIQLHIDFYDTKLPLNTRRALVENSVKWHMRKGTAAVVQELVNTIWDSGIVREWYEYGGDPYYFKVDVLEAPIDDAEEIAAIVKAINTVKNKRSWLDSINFLRRFSGTQYYGVASHLHRRYAISQVLTTATSGTMYVTGVTANNKKLSIMQVAAVDDVSLNMDRYSVVAPVIHRSYKV